jgi:hypothetical protein
MERNVPAQNFFKTITLLTFEIKKIIGKGIIVWYINEGDFIVSAVLKHLIREKVKKTTYFLYFSTII